MCVTTAELEVGQLGGEMITWASAMAEVPLEWDAHTANPANRTESS